MKALITGVAGFVGSHLAERLDADGVDIVGVDAFTDYYDPDAKRSNLADVGDSSRFRLIEKPMSKIDLEDLLQDVDVVYHLAGQPGVRASWGDEFGTYLDDNVLATQQLLEAAKNSDVGRIVFASSSSIYGDAEHFPTPESEPPAPVSPYGVTKLAAEHLCRLYHRNFEVPVVVLRYFTIFGPRQRPDMAFTRFIQRALQNEPIPLFGDGEQSRDFTYVDDCVTATIAAAARGRPGATYNIAGGTQATIAEVISELERLLDRHIAVDRQPAVAGDARKTGADTTLARTDLGFQPAVSLSDGLGRQLDSQRNVRATRGQ